MDRLKRQGSERRATLAYICLVRHSSISLLALLRSSINTKFSRQRYQPATQITLSLRKVLPCSLILRLSLIKSLSIEVGHSRTPLTQLYLLFAMAQQMLREADEQARKVEALGKIEPYYNNLWEQKIFFGRFGPRMVSINGIQVPPGLAKLILKVIDRTFHTELIPLGGNYQFPWAAKLQSKILGTGKDIIRRKKEQERTDLGSQVWFSRYQARGGLFHWAFIVHDLVENSFTKYELCKVRDGEVKGDGLHFSEPVNGGDGNQYHFRSKPIFLDLDIRGKHILETGYPEDGTFHICLIGWTRMTRDGIDHIGDSIMQDFGKYTPFWNNCQRFLRKLNDRIRNQRAPQAADYSWFEKNMRTPYQRRKKLMK